MKKLNNVYRVRQGFFGKSILQVIVNHPSLIAGQVDNHIRDIYWADVKYDRAPSFLIDTEKA